MFKPAFFSGCLAIILSLTANLAMADKINKDEAKQTFWSLMEDIQNEDPAYFDFFKTDAKITYTMPASYEMPSGDISVSELREVIQGFWQYSENHSFDTSNPTISIDGKNAKIKATVYERYTMEGYTLSNKSTQTFTLRKVNGKVKVTQFVNNIEDISDSEYQEALATMPKKSTK